MVALNAVDYLIILVLVSSTLVSLFRGFSKEALSLANWAVAFVIAQLFSGRFAQVLAQLGVLDESVFRGVVAYLGLFILSLGVGSVVVRFLSELVKKTVLAPADRVFGILFGLLRGVILVTLAVGLLSWAGASSHPLWQGAQLIGVFFELELWARQNLGQFLST